MCFSKINVVVVIEKFARSELTIPNDFLDLLELQQVLAIYTFPVCRERMALRNQLTILCEWPGILLKGSRIKMDSSLWLRYVSQGPWPDQLP